MLLDARWIGPHGIGRFAGELRDRIAFETPALPGRPMSPLDPLRLAWALRASAADTLFFSPGYNAPLWSHGPFVLTVHDLNHIDRPENSSILKRLYYAVVLKRTCARAAAVFTVSEFSRGRLVEWAGLDADKVFNVGNGVSEQFRPEGSTPDGAQPYVLCVGNRKLHKNELRTVSAFAAANLGDDYMLMFTGEPNAQLAQHISSLGLERRVKFAGQVDEAHLATLYRGARVLLFASLYEGFGLPVVEAFACGTPVITSNTTSLPEVAGDAAWLVDPLSVDGMAAALRRVASDPALRQQMRERGMARAESCTWLSVTARVETVLAAVGRGLRVGDSGWPTAASTEASRP